MEKGRLRSRPSLYITGGEFFLMDCQLSGFNLSRLLRNPIAVHTSILIYPNLKGLSIQENQQDEGQ